MFENALFIKPDIPFEKDRNAPAPMFRRTFFLEKKPEKAVLHTVALGYGCFYINGRPVTQDRFLAPVSDYTKTLWYTSHEVTDLLVEGENVLAVICGNGFYNEYMKSSWDYDAAPWRDNPKFIAQLDGDGTAILVSDTQFRCSIDSPVVYNQLRLGEHYDSRLYREGWNGLGFDDSQWPFAMADDTPPTGVFRLCDCEPIRECQILEPVSVREMGEGKYLYDFGKNMSGYLRIRVNQPAGDKLTLHYRESSHEDGSIRINPTEFKHYPGNEDLAQVDTFICCGKEFQWAPRFTYHGFRYVLISGLRSPCEAQAVFVHQDVKRRSQFRCSDPVLNSLFDCGIQSTWSNMFYMPTDCPTREKLGWCNDAQSSTEQFMTNFAAGAFFEKWLQDIWDSMKENGALPGIAPTSGWGYQWGNGPVSEGILFEIPYRVWLHTGNTQILTKSIPYFLRSLAFLDSMEVNGELRYGLDDWAAYKTPAVSAPFVNGALQIKFYSIAILAMELAGEEASGLRQRKAELVQRFKDKYLLGDGTCKVHKQTAVAMMLVLELYDDPQPLQAQLKALVEEEDFHHDCGMVGIPYLLMALNRCGLQEYAYRIITAKDAPSYGAWVADGATTLYEYWGMDHSKNHHMYSDVISWLVKTPLGLVDTYKKITVDPCFLEALSFAEGSLDGVKVRWQREEGGIRLEITVSGDVNAEYRGQRLENGTHQFYLEEK